MELARITLRSGRSLALTGLHVSLTYGGWIEGVPIPGDNDRLLEQLAAGSRTMSGSWPVHVVDGPRRLMPGSGARAGPHERLPR